MSSKVIQTTEELVLPILKQKNLELVDVEYVKEGKNWFLRVYIDKEGGVDITECGEVSEELSERLDQTDPIAEAYFLEVSSPGAERPLKKKKDFEENMNKQIYVKLYEPINGEKEYEGKLVDFANDVVTISYKLKTRNQTVEIPFEKIAKARLAVSF
ncbi:MULTISPECIES: ribosome maturation factor RimP [Virgibacillus]|uniref:Ribosome maturation factor RimP n=1 Tax=Virgibacillus dokdonensis TaxID=302167 RepID=A0A2K9J4M2_9BACI|nr:MULTISPECIES: ribosome maturation factor RimP [Virgibacillus]AUJ26645.1 Ribosome maturation factor RimP [Virgibacillus dokdonensis]NWO13006.1 ribosome maturation factor RimP [Virgibacillus sp.]